MKTSTPVAAFSFGEELDSRPIYLGRDKSDSSYWFYALKGNAARFLKYVNYFHWDRGPQSILELDPLPVTIEQELEQFLEGQVIYEFVKKRKNSRNTTVLKSYRNPSDAAGNVACSDSTEHGLPDSGRDGMRHAVDGHAHPAAETGGGRLSEPRGAISHACETEPGNDGPQPVTRTVKRVIRKKPTEVGGHSVPPKLEEDRPAQSAKSETSIDSELTCEQSPRLELGQLGLLKGSPAKRGRPRKLS